MMKSAFAIRDDDVCFFTKPEDLDTVFSDIWQVMPVSFSVVPFHGCTKSGSVPKEFYNGNEIFPLGENKALVNYLREKIKEGKISICLHGYSHKEENGVFEFQGNEGLFEKVQKGKDYLESLLGTRIKTFVPPQNTIARSGMEAVDKLGLNLTCVPPFRPAYRHFSARYLIHFIKLKYYRIRYRHPYPKILNMGSHKEVYCHKLERPQDLERLKSELVFCLKRGGRFCLNTHYWQLRDSVQLRDTLYELVRYAKRLEGIALVDVDNLFSCDNLGLDDEFNPAGRIPVKRILYLTYGPQSFVVENLSQHLSQKNLQVNVFNAARKVHYRHPKFKIPSLRPSNLLNSFLAAAQFAKDWKFYFYRTTFAFWLMTNRCRRKLIADGANYDYILQSGALFYCPSMEFGIPYMLYLDHTSILSEAYSDVKGLPSSLRLSPRYKSKEKMIYQDAGHIFTMSRIVKNSLVMDYGIEDSKISVIGAGPNLEIPPLGWVKSQKNKTVLFVGKDFYPKGGETLLRAFELVTERIKDAQLIVVGGKHPVVKKRGIEFVGRIPSQEIGKFYKMADIFVLPTLREAFGLSFLEAMAYKLPCVGTNIEAIPEIIDDGVTGYVVPTGDYVALAEKIISILDSPDKAKRMGEEGYKKIVSFYNWDEVAGKISHQLKKLKRLECAVCNFQKYSVTTTVNGYPILKCLCCGYTWARLNPSFDYEEFYSKYYFEGAHKDVYSGYEKYIQDRLNNFDLYKKGYEEHLEKIEMFRPQPGKLLEIGCAAGFFLKMASQRGWDCYGVDISKYAADYAKEKLHLNVKHGNVSEAGYPDSYFDIIYSYQTLEHTHDPRAILEEAFRILKPGGLLVIGTIDFGSMYARFLGLFRRGYRMLSPPEHISYFTHKTLKLIFKNTGFNLIAFEKEEIPEDSLDKMYLFVPDSKPRPMLKQILKNAIVFGAKPFSPILKHLYVDDKIIVYGQKVSR